MMRTFSFELREMQEFFRSYHRRRASRADVGGVGPTDFAVFLAVEVKRPASDRHSAGRLTKEQAEFLCEIERVGDIAIVAHSVDELANSLAEYL